MANENSSIKSKNAKPKKGGLPAGAGASVFYQPTGEDQNGETTQNNAPLSKETDKKTSGFKTTVRLTNSTFAKLSELRVTFREQRNKTVSFNEIIDEAVQAYFEQVKKESL